MTTSVFVRTVITAVLFSLTSNCVLFSPTCCAGGGRIIFREEGRTRSISCFCKDGLLLHFITCGQPHSLLLLIKHDLPYRTLCFFVVFMHAPRGIHFLRVNFWIAFTTDAHHVSTILSKVMTIVLFSSNVHMLSVFTRPPNEPFSSHVVLPPSANPTPMDVEEICHAMFFARVPSGTSIYTVTSCKFWVQKYRSHTPPFPMGICFPFSL